jgi:hypothetical protein
MAMSIKKGNRSKTDSVRVQGRVSQADNELLNEWSVKLGLDKSQLISISVHAGLGAILRAVDPMASLTPDQLNKLKNAFESEENWSSTSATQGKLSPQV